jgi:hypothetical protein
MLNPLQIRISKVVRTWARSQSCVYQDDRFFWDVAPCSMPPSGR